MNISLKVNGQSHTVDVDPTTPLLYVLSDDLALRGPKFGCGLGQCGACTVLVDGRNTRSCQTPAERAVGKTVVTVEGASGPVTDAVHDMRANPCGVTVMANEEQCHHH
jgi:aerobic-type carbon monoxide dehydrogenase small subunit (CoxS/CutS family)